jgi:hypothetical protein
MRKFWDKLTAPKPQVYYIVEHPYMGGSLWKAHPATKFPAPWDPYNSITATYSFSVHGGSADECESKLRKWIAEHPPEEGRVVRVVTFP